MIRNGIHGFLQGFMASPQRFAALVGIPVFTLFLGFQLGQRYEENKSDLANLARTSSTIGNRNITDPKRQVDINLLWQVWDTMLDRYVEKAELNPDKMRLGAVHGMVEAVGDPYTVFMSPDENKDFRQSLLGQIQGIGAELSQEGERVVVVSPIKGSPAQKAGLLPEDVIFKVNDEDMTGKPLDEVVKKVRGPKGTTVKLTVLRSSKTVALSIVRDEVKVPSTEYEVKKTDKGDIGYLSLNQFGDETVADATSALHEMLHTKLKGVILDLRFNGGGYLDGADELTSLFLKEGEVVSIETRDAEPQKHFVSGRPLVPDLPLVILVNQGTASASEIVAGALQDHKRATLIGMKTFGKGTVQEVIDFPGGSSLRVTIAKWFTPSGKNVAKTGLTPDIVVDRTEEDFKAKQDPQLQAAIEFVTEGRVVTVKTGVASSGSSSSGK